ncbi:MAG: methyltransferase domain-containing protein, partial [Burkholderiales bacterium]|nr:methyltransferase domain-containing protein [Burkholderiales bacterium]
MARLIFILLVVLAASFAQVVAKESSVSPGINAPFVQPNFEEWVERFERGGREVFDKRYEIVAAVDIKPGMVVADIGAGTGLFTRLFAPEVGVKGRVIAVDISKPFIDNILKNARQRGLKNVTGIVNEATDAMLLLGSVD